MQRADPLAPLITPGFLEYAQTRGFVIDRTRVRSPRDKGRVERTVQTVRDDCFAGEHLYTIEQAAEHSRHWSLEEYGHRRHSRTQRFPLEHFEAEEKSKLLPPPSSPYEVPLWCEPVVARDQCAQVAKALYSLPTRFIGKRLRARADSTTVRFYENAALVKMHARQPPGGHSIDPTDYPPEKTAYAMRDVAFSKNRRSSTANQWAASPTRYSRARCPGPACGGCTHCLASHGATAMHASRRPAPRPSVPACSTCIASSGC